MVEPDSLTRWALRNMKGRSTRCCTNWRALRMADVALVCPNCRLEVLSAAAPECHVCHSRFPIVDGIPVLVSSEASRHAAVQARWFGDEVDAEWEIERPSGSPQFHQWLLLEKFRRAVGNLDL